MSDTVPQGKKEISIAGEVFVVSAPYAEGHLLTAAEAKVLNQTRAENIGNNFRKAVKDALAVEGGDLTKVRDELITYDAEYQFTLTNTARSPVDPIEAEAFAIARENVRAKIQAKGEFKTIKAYVAVEGNQAKYDAAVEKVATQPAVLAEAKKRVAAKNKAKDIEIGDIEL